jgi:hypothetical protein
MIKTIGKVMIVLTLLTVPVFYTQATNLKAGENKEELPSWNTLCMCGKKIKTDKYYVKSKKYKVHACSSKCKTMVRKNINTIVKQLKKKGVEPNGK